MSETSHDPHDGKSAWDIAVEGNERASSSLAPVAGSAPVTGDEIARVAAALSLQGFNRFASANDMDDEDDPDGTLRAGLKRDAKVFEHCACLLSVHASETPNGPDEGRRDNKITMKKLTSRKRGAAKRSYAEPAGSDASLDRLKRRRLIKRLEPFAKRYAEICSAIEESPAATLRSLIAATEAVSVTNCWWATFQIAPTVRKLAEGELFRSDDDVRV